MRQVSTCGSYYHSLYLERKYWFHSIQFSHHFEFQGRRKTVFLIEINLIKDDNLVG